MEEKAKREITPEKHRPRTPEAPRKKSGSEELDDTIEENVESPWMIPASFNASTGRRQLKEFWNYAMPVVLSLAECFEMGNVTWTGSKTAGNRFTVKAT